MAEKWLVTPFLFGVALISKICYNIHLMDEKNETQILEELKKQCEEYLNGWKRAKADFVNYQKDEAKRFATIMQMANEVIIRELLIVLDSFNLALLASPSNRESLSLIKSQLEDILKRNGLEKISVNIGQVFDPAWHEAVADVESVDQSSNTIVEIIGIGYTLHGKIIRPARVKVVK